MSKTIITIRPWFMMGNTATPEPNAKFCMPPRSNFVRILKGGVYELTGSNVLYYRQGIDGTAKPVTVIDTSVPYNGHCRVVLQPDDYVYNADDGWGDNITIDPCLEWVSSE